MSSCSEQSLSINESLHGTAPPSVHFFILLEYKGVWPKKVSLNGLDLDATISSRIDALLQSNSKSRLLLIRKPRPDPMARIFLVDTQTHTMRWAYLDAEWKPNGIDGFQHSSNPMTLVCTHGLRDACCSRKGGAFFRALKKRDSDAVWQSSHLGGHRFAATAIHFPSGRLYGRLLPADAVYFTPLAEPMLLDKFRGTTRYDRPTQFAEIELLKAGRQSLEFIDQTPLDDDKFRVRFRSAGSVVSGVVGRQNTGQSRCVSCGDTEPKFAYEWFFDWD